MPQQSIQYLKNLFRTSLKPIQQDFHDWIESFWHKDEQIPISKIVSLQSRLDDLEANQSSGIVLHGKYNSDAEAGLGGVASGTYYAAGNEHVDGIREGTPVERIY